MKVYWHLCCDYGHQWGGFFEEDADIPMQCTDGHEAITCSKQAPIDQVQVTIRPAGRITDSVRHQTAFERYVWIIVSDIQGTWEYRSNKVYSWREAEQLIRLFESCTLDKAKLTVEKRPF
jgi:hypothetical protein